MSELSGICPTVQGYGYYPDAGLSRVEMCDGVVRQRRKWRNARMTINLRFQLTLEQMKAAEAFVTNIGSDWFTITIYTGAGGSAPSLHTVRIIKDPQIKMFNGNRNFEYLLVVETAGSIS